MAEPPVVNASPLIFLAGGRCFELLQITGERVRVPSTVASEIRRRGESDPAVQAIERSDWVGVVDDVPVPSLIQSWDLGPGESAVLALAHASPSTVAIIDDLAARRCAAALGIPLRGTLSLVLAAKQRGVITAARYCEQGRSVGAPMRWMSRPPAVPDGRPIGELSVRPV